MRLLPPAPASVRAMALLCAASLVSLAQAQSIKPAWHGTWTSGGDTLVITDKAFQIGQQTCAWAHAKPAKVVACTAHPDEPGHKDQLVRLIDDAEVAAKEGAKNAAVQAGLAQSRQALKGVSRKEFETVAASATGQGDCARFYFLDKGLLYGVLDCTSKPQAARIQVYRKAS